jgi:hypothetical protein
MKKRSTFLAITETEIKTTLRFHLSTVRMAIIKKTSNNKCHHEVERNPHTLLVACELV